MSKTPNLPKNLKILVVDDMVSLVEKMISILKDIGFEKIQAAANGKRALKMIVCEQMANEPFDLVILDINMPMMNGLKLLEEVKKMNVSESTKYFIVTTRSEVDVVINAIDLGAKNYLIKPFNQEKIKEKIFEIFYPENNK